MAPVTSILLSPAELSYLQNSLSQIPPIRPDGRTPTQFRPLIAETDILPATNGSARICFSDGTEAIVGVKAEVEKTLSSPITHGRNGEDNTDTNVVEGDETINKSKQVIKKAKGSDSWVEVVVEMPGFRDDDQLPVFLSLMLSEAILADGTLRDRLYINSRFHWVLYVDILLLSAPLSYPLPLLSLTTHLALLQTRLPALISEQEEDPLFNDDWDAAVPLYPKTNTVKPPVTLLVVTVGDNLLFDPGQDELAVADSVIAISLAETQTANDNTRQMSVVSIRLVDPPARFTHPGIPDSMNQATGGKPPNSEEELIAMTERSDPQKVWRVPRGGIRRGLVAQVISAVLAKDGVAAEVLDALAAVDQR